MSETVDSIAKRELIDAYQKAITAGAVDNESAEGLAFGQICVKWHDWYKTHKNKEKGDRIRFMWRALHIPHTAAYHWMGLYRKASGEKPPIVQYTAEELARSQQKAENENRLVPLFADCGFHYDIKQNCAVAEPHFNVIFSALTENAVKKLAEQILRGKK